jgi:hypothetical protein
LLLGFGEKALQNLLSLFFGKCVEERREEMERKIGKAMMLIMVLLTMSVPTGPLGHLTSNKEDGFG